MISLIHAIGTLISSQFHPSSNAYMLPYVFFLTLVVSYKCHFYPNVTSRKDAVHAWNDFFSAVNTETVGGFSSGDRFKSTANRKL